MLAVAAQPQGFVAFLALVAVSFALVACGGDDDGAAASGGGEAASGGVSVANGEGGTTVSIATAPDGGLAYTTDQLTARAGDVRVDFTNPQPIAHDIDFEDAGGKIVGDTEIVFETTQDVTMKNLKRGEYTFYCSVPGHREGGMVGTLTVE